MSNETEQRLAASLTAQTTELIPYLPYLLQDFYELGADPEVVEALLRKHTDIGADTRILELDCGKGAVGIRLAKAFGCSVYGADLMPTFIDEAKAAAANAGLSDRCVYETGDVNEVLKTARGFDIAIMTDVSEILGCSIDTVRKLKGTVKPDGYVLIEDAYEGCAGSGYATRGQWHEAFENAGVRVVCEEKADADELHTEIAREMEWIKQRAQELSDKYPKKREMFEEYVKRQIAEGNALENDLVCVTWLLQA